MILVTGGAGFIGSHLIEALLAKKEKVVCLDNFDNFYNPGLKEKNIAGFLDKNNFTLVKGDVRDKAILTSLFSRFPIEVIVHLAARPGVRPSLQEPLLYAEVNISGTIQLLEFARQKKIKSFIFGSSSSVYGLSPGLPFKEEDYLKSPVSPYAVSKLAAEYYAELYHRLYGLPVVILRFFTVYGPRQRPEMAICRFAELIERGEEITLFGEGATERDYTYVDDIISGILSCLEKRFDLEVFNLGDSRTIKLTYLISLLESALNKKARIKKLGPQPGEVPITCADITKAGEKLSYAPRVLIEEGIEKFITWYKGER